MYSERWRDVAAEMKRGWKVETDLRSQCSLLLVDNMVVKK
jgi:hypothetical protein